MLHHRCIHDAGILTTRWSSKSKPPASLLEVLGSRFFTFRCPACIINLTSTDLTLPNLNNNVPTDTTNTQTIEPNATNITPNITELDLQINTILTTLKSHTIQIQSLMTQNRPLTNIPLNNTTKYNNDLPPMTYTPRLNTNNYNNNFPSNTHTPRLKQNWLTNNNLLLNHNKTELLNITNDPNTYFPDIIINQHKIIPTNSVKYLGVNFNNKLNLDKHYSLLTQSTTAQLFNIKKIRPYLNRNTTKLLTQTLKLSRLQYCNSLFTVTEKLKIDKLDKIINRSIRNIYRLQKTDYTTSITDLRKKLNWLNTEDSINYKILTILKKTITYNLPYNLRNKIKHKPNTRLLRNKNSTILHQPITHCIKYERSKFSSSSIIRWNKLPPQFRNKNLSINIFKKK